MAVSASDLIAYCSLNMPSDNTSVSGGAIDPDTRVYFDPLSAMSALEVKSSSASDTTVQCTLRGRKSDGTLVSQTVTLSGTTAVPFNTLPQVFRVLKVSLNADPVGTVTIQTVGGSLIVGTIPPGERGFLYFHREGTASPSAAIDFYYKIFLKNTNGSAQSLTVPVVTEVADPVGRITFALAASNNDSGSVANRLTSPGLTFDSNPKNGPATLAPNDALGVWLKVTHPAGDASAESSYTLQLAGV